MADSATTRIILVDDHLLVRQLFSTILRAEDDMTVVGEAADGDSTLRLVEEVEADVVLLDLNLPGVSGVELLSELRRRRPELKVLVLTGYGEEARGPAMKAGAVGYLSKMDVLGSLPNAIREAKG